MHTECGINNSDSSEMEYGYSKLSKYDLVNTDILYFLG